MTRTAEKQEADGYAAGIETRDEGRNGTRRHEGACAIHIAHRLPHRLLHVRAFPEGQLHEGCALHALAVHRLNARDVEEVVLVVVGEESFHLRRVHAAIRLCDVDDRIADLRKDVHPHAAYRHEEASDNRDQGYDHGERPTESCEYETHSDRVLC